VRRTTFSDVARSVLRSGYRAARTGLAGYGLPRFRIVRSAERLVRAALRTDVVTVLGHRMRLDAHDRGELSIHGIYEPLTTELVRAEIGPRSVVLDIGANIGYYTLIFANRVGPQGRVFAFEPEPGNFALLEENVTANGYRNVTLSRVAASDREGGARLYTDPGNPGDCRIFDSHDHRPSLEIETVRLDEYFDAFPRGIDLIKMDVQGAESAALQGMLGLVEKNRRVKLVMEFWPYGLGLAGSSAEAFLRTLFGLGFQVWNVDERRGALAPTSAPELLERYPPVPDRATNLYCVRP
jgi:FkbM family methyltransferase